MLFTLLAFAVALGVLVTFHELGHYWVARRCGVKVLKFSVGFGKVLARRYDKHGTEWALSAIPLGGYVKMQDEPEAGSDPDTADQAFSRKPLWQRAAIVLAGPVANLILAAFLYAILNLMGAQQPAAIIAEPPAGTPAAHAGLTEGDRILAIDEQPVASWDGARWELLNILTSGGTVQLRVESADGRQRERVVNIPRLTMEPEGVDLMEEVGLGLLPPRPLIRDTVAGGAGAAAGLRAGDIIVRIVDIDAPTPREVVTAVSARPGEPVPLSVLRDGVLLQLNVTPQAHVDEDGQTIGRMGVMLGADFPMVMVRYGVVESITRGIERTWDTIWFSLKMMGRMVTGEVSLRNVSGPVTIADYAGQTARIGLASYIGFMALISVSIGVLNLLPIPMLDGGHLLYYAIEAVRRKPIPDRWLVNGQRIGLALLAGLMSLAFFNDLTRLFS